MPNILTIRTKILTPYLITMLQTGTIKVKRSYYWGINAGAYCKRIIIQYIHRYILVIIIQDIQGEAHKLKLRNYRIFIGRRGGGGYCGHTHRRSGGRKMFYEAIFLYASSLQTLYTPLVNELVHQIICWLRDSLNWTGEWTAIKGVPSSLSRRHIWVIINLCVTREAADNSYRAVIPLTTAICSSFGTFSLVRRECMVVISPIKQPLYRRHGSLLGGFSVHAAQVICSLQCIVTLESRTQIFR